MNRVHVNYLWETEKFREINALKNLTQGKTKKFQKKIVFLKQGMLFSLLKQLFFSHTCCWSSKILVKFAILPNT